MPVSMMWLLKVSRSTIAAHSRASVKVRFHSENGALEATAIAWIGDDAFEVEYLVHESLLRSNGEFPCAGDPEALHFCREIADEMVSAFGVTGDEAVAAVNRQWPNAESAGRSPRVWIVGLDIVYHETPEYWSAHIFHSHSSP